MKRLALFMLLAMVGMTVAGFATPASAARTWTVIAGGGNKDFAVVSNAFHPGSVEVAVGDTVRWRFQGFHNVAFTGGQQPPNLEIEEGGNHYINPQVLFPAGGKSYAGHGYRNSGLPPEDPAAFAKFTYTVTFTKAGTFQYQCIVHGPAMSGTVVVKDAAMGSPSATARTGRADQTKTIRAGQAAWAAYRTEREGATVVVPMLGDPRAGWSFLRFSLRPLVISPGTTVKWVMRDPFEIHTVTFPGGSKPEEFILPQPQAQGPPKLLINPKVAAPAGGKTYDGVGLVNSGILYPPGAPDPLPKSFSLTFTKPGQYAYVCIVHIREGMVSTVIVK